MTTYTEQADSKHLASTRRAIKESFERLQAKLNRNDREAREHANDGRRMALLVEEAGILAHEARDLEKCKRFLELTS